MFAALRSICDEASCGHGHAGPAPIPNDPPSSPNSEQENSLWALLSTASRHQRRLTSLNHDGAAAAEEKGVELGNLVPHRQESFPLTEVHVLYAQAISAMCHAPPSLCQSTGQAKSELDDVDILPDKEAIVASFMAVGIPLCSIWGNALKHSTPFFINPLPTASLPRQVDVESSVVHLRHALLRAAPQTIGAVLKLQRFVPPCSNGHGQRANDTAKRTRSDDNEALQSRPQQRWTPQTIGPKPPVPKSHPFTELAQVRRGLSPTTVSPLSPSSSAAPNAATAPNKSTTEVLPRSRSNSPPPPGLLASRLRPSFIFHGAVNGERRGPTTSTTVGPVRPSVLTVSEAPSAPVIRAPVYPVQRREEAVANTAAPIGFITAADQLLADVKAGRTMSTTALSRRSPALGLRRSGFQAPFQQQQQPGQPEDETSSVAVGGPPHRGCRPEPALSGRGGGSGATRSKRSVGTANDELKEGSPDGADEKNGYPQSLLLPDGSVPPILLPLDPRLVTQVALEIMEGGAGSKQVGWEDIAGLEHAKASVEEAIVWPLRRPDLFVGLRDPPRGLLLFGPPGTGKTMIARAIANRAQCTFLNISSSSLMSKWVGDGEKLVRCLFAVATVKQPSVIFIDEIDSLLSMRGEGEMDAVRRVKTEFLVQLDGVATDQGDRVLLIGATNRPDELDEAARRRMEKRLYIPLPEASARLELIRRLLRSLEAPAESDRPGSATPAVHTLTDSDLEQLVQNTDGYSGADLKQLCREAAMGPLRDMSVGQLNEVAAADLRPIQRRDFRQALRRLKPSVSADEVARYTAWNMTFGSFNGNEAEEDDDDD